jgi:hypothetical protein
MLEDLKSIIKAPHCSGFARHTELDQAEARFRTRQHIRISGRAGSRQNNMIQHMSVELCGVLHAN